MRYLKKRIIIRKYEGDFMKRLLAFVLSLVLLLGSIPVNPVHVHAEDLDGLVETEIIPETEETVPEETEAVVPEQTVPEETVPEETVPEETVPEETVPEETVPEETVPEETVPEETVPEETVPEEIIPEETEEAVAAADEIFEELVYVPNVDLPDNEDLFEAYAEYVLYGENTLHSKDAALYGTAAGKRLSGDEKVLYTALAAEFKKIAKGERSSTIIAVGTGTGDVSATFTGDGFSSYTFGRVIDALLCDLPYAQYWYDKTTGCSASQSWDSNDKLAKITVKFTVDDYIKSGDDYTVNTTKAGAATKSAEKAAAIVSKYAGQTDYAKLVGYKTEICNLVEYDHAAVERGDFDVNNNPWQLIWVFDGDSSTNVVCEGYSKAYQYLCDQTDFADSTECYTVWGDIGGGHMWNIVKLDGKNYMVDITNSDSGTVGQNGGLFLSGGSGSPSGGYYFLNYGIKFVYDDDMKDLWGTGTTSILYLSSTDYTPCQHSFGSWTVVTAGSCTTKGVERRECSKCGAYETRETAGGGHSYGAVITAPGCESQGYTTYTCSACGDSYVASYVDALGHDAGTWSETVAPTCTKEGVESAACGRCGQTLTRPVPATGHKHTPVVTAPTCTADGYTTYICTCGDSYTADPVPSTGHTGGTATCKDLAVCATCSAPYGELNPANHAGGTEIRDAIPVTCTEHGYSGDTYCQGCGVKIVTGSLIASVGHSFGEWFYEVAPTCTEKGSERRECANCDVFETREAEALGHNYEAVVTAPTCLDQGFTTYTCSGCGDTYQDSYLSPLGHSWDEGVITLEPSFYEPGIRLLTCTACGTTKEKPVPALSHKHNHIDIKKVEPTYTQQGYTVYMCECEDTYNDDFVPALGLPKPVVTVAANAVTGGATLTWEAASLIEGVEDEADCYKIYRATSSKGKYTEVAEVTGTTAEVSVPVGKTYYFKVKAVCNDDSALSSAQSAAAKATGKCAQPTITVEAGSTGKPVVKWEKVTSAKKYEVYRATSETGKYTKVTTTTKLTYTDTKATVGKTYFYKVKAVASKTTYNSAYSEVKSCLTVCAQPALTVTVNSTTGKPSLSWKKITGAIRYDVYRAASENGEYALVATQTAISFKDESAAPDTDYWYKVIAIGETAELNSAESAVKMIHSTLAKPAVVFSVDPATGKPKLTWDAVEGVVEYKVYRSTSATKSYKVVHTTTELEFLDSTVSTGKGYYYKVVAIGENCKSADSAYKKLTATCASPVATAEPNVSTGKPKISWTKVTGAKKYEVYRATSENGKYSKVTTTTKLTYTDTKATVGKTYFYKVKSVGSKTAYNSPYSEIVSQTCILAAPTITVSNVSGSGDVKLTWKAITGAVEYKIFRAPADTEDFVEFDTVTGTTYTDDQMEVGESFTYRIQSIHTDEAVNSALSTPVTGARKLSSPVVTGEALGTNQAQLRWNAVPVAVSYTVSQATSKTGTYKVLGTVDVVDGQTEYTYDVSVPAGKTYYYKVVANGANPAADSAAGTASIQGKLSAPEMKTTASVTKNTIKVSWNKVTGASGYNVYRRAAGSDGAWTKVGSTTSTSYNNTKVTAGKYEYCVSAYKTISKTKYDGIKSEPIVARTLAATTVSVPDSGVMFHNVIYWNQVSGATAYELWYYTSADKTQRMLGTFTDVYEFDHEVVHGAYYYYQVRPIYEENGVTSYGPFAYSDHNWRWFHGPKGNLQYNMSKTTDSSTSSTVIWVQNSGPDNLRVYASGGKWLDKDYYSYDRNIVLYDYETFDKQGRLKTVSYQDIPAGTSSYLLIGVKGNPTWYDKYTRIRLTIEYCGRKYTTYFSYYYGITYYQQN